MLTLIGRTIQFNMAKMLPDVVLETYVGPSSTNVLPPGVGFRYSVCMYVTSCTYVCRYVYKVFYFIIIFTPHVHTYVRNLLLFINNIIFIEEMLK